MSYRRLRAKLASVEVPDVRYARSGDVFVAFQVFGEGPIDLLFTQGSSNLFWMWQQPLFVRLYTHLASFSRLILLDRRGTGLSDRPRALTLESQMDDIGAVLDAVGSDRAALFGAYAGGQACLLFAATYPERTAGLALFNTPARAVVDEEAVTRERLQQFADDAGNREHLRDQARTLNPSLANDEEYLDWFVWWSRLAASPGAEYAFQRMLAEVDLREVVRAVRVPTLLLYREEYAGPALELAELFEGARVVRLPGMDSGVYVGEEPGEEVRKFLMGVVDEPVPDTVLTTVLFTDIPSSTERTAVLGDRAWRDLLARHHAIVRRELRRYRGEERDTAGDGFFATFDGPARAIRCGQAIVQNLRGLGVEVRVGVHTGECEVHEAKVVGFAVNAGARIAAAARPGEVLTSGTVKDLVAGSAIEFKDERRETLKGLPGEWRLYTVASEN